MITASVVWQTPMIDTQGFMYMHTCIKNIICMDILNYIFLSNWWISKHQDKVVCQQPRMTCGTQVCYLQEPLNPRFQPLICISTTTGQNCTYFKPSIYTTSHTKLEDNLFSSLQDLFLKIAQFSSHFSSSHHFRKQILKITFLQINFLQIWYTN